MSKTLDKINDLLQTSQRIGGYEISLINEIKIAAMNDRQTIAIYEDLLGTLRSQQFDKNNAENVYTEMIDAALVPEKRKNYVSDLRAQIADLKEHIHTLENPRDIMCPLCMEVTCDDDCENPRDNDGGIKAVYMQRPNETKDDFIKRCQDGEDPIKTFK